MSPRALAIKALELLAHDEACQQLLIALGHQRERQPGERAAYQSELAGILATGGREAEVLRVAIGLCAGDGSELPGMLPNGGTFAVEDETGVQMLHPTRH
jgi:hypothetical protein